ncbi:hypothetical protein [Amaricoccus tamworthensis]|uniref:hypothetical protein n=1 Tax=Amaricoccus tamworthensis TaxID=57002 RepID=UPI003C7E942E
MARWLVINGFHGDFFWQAAQCLEKYLKAALLVNETDVSRFGHNLTQLFETLSTKMPGYVAAEFCKPEQLHSDHWRGGSKLDFVREMERKGSPESRYGLVSWNREPDELFKLDQLAFDIRRLTVGLNWVIGIDFDIDLRDEGFRGRTYGDVLKSDASYTPRELFGEWDKLICFPSQQFPAKTRDDVLRTWNFPFGLGDSKTGAECPSNILPTFGPFLNNPLYMLLQRLRAKHPGDTLTREGTTWLLRNIKLSKQDKRALEILL